MRYFISEFRCQELDDDAVIEACFEKAKETADNEIVFDEPEYLISRAILLPSNTTVVLDGCKIKQKDFTFDNVFRGDNLELDPRDSANMPLSVLPIENIKILGKNGAVISGPDRNGHDLHPTKKEIQEKVGDFWGWRTLAVCFSKCNGLEIAGIHFIQNRCWCISLDLCENGYLHDIRIDSNIKNGDGIDLRSGCHHFLIEKISGVTSDDNIACTALFKNDYEYVYPMETSVYPMEPARKTGNRTQWERDISDVTIRNCKVGGLHHGIICLASSGCQVYDIHIENIEESEFGDWKVPYNQAAIKLYTGYGSGYTAGDLHDITIKNVLSKYATYPVYCNAEVKNVTLEQVISEPGHEMKLDYPEGFEIV